MSVSTESTPGARSGLLYLPALLQRQISAYFERPAVRTKSRRLTYGELNQQSNRFAKSLLNSGVRPQTLVGIFMARSPESLSAQLGIWKVGAAYLALDPMTPPERLAFMLRDSDVGVILTDRDLAPLLPPHDRPIIYTDDVLSENFSESEIVASEVSPDSLAYVLYTSGSTGKPKGVEVCHRGLANVVTAIAGELRLTPGEVLLAHTSLCFDVSNLEMYLPLVSGGCLYAAENSRVGDGARLIQLLRESGATTMLGTCSLWRLLLDAGWEGKPDLRVISGGEVLTEDLARALCQRTAEVWNQYGPSEATICSTTARIHSSTEKITLGKALPNVTVHVLDANLCHVPAGQVGEVYIGGVGVGRAYRNRPGLTAASFLNDPFNSEPGSRLYKTGDLGSKLADGTLEFHGRLDHQVKIHGYRIELGEIEQQLCQFPEVNVAVVLASQRDRETQRLVACFESRRAIPASELRRFLQGRLPHYMIPAEFRHLDSMPLNDNGKVDRALLQKEVFLATRNAPAPLDLVTGNEVESQLRSVWEDLLQIKPIALTDNFFDLGGDSLLAALLVSQLSQEWGCAITPDILLECPTIQSLAARITMRRTSWPAGALVPLRAGGSKPPLFIVHGLGGSALLFRTLSACLPGDQPVYGVTLPSGAIRDISEVAIETLAAKILAEIRLICRSGPFHIAGHSFGALVAFEMAAQLARAGQTPGLLALIDADRNIAKNGAIEHLAMPRQLLGRYKAKLKSLRQKGVGEVVRRRLEYVKLKSRVKLAERVFDSEAYDGSLGASELMVLAARNYQPPFYPAEAVLLRAGDEVRNLTDASLGWAEVMGDGLEVVELPGAHLTIFDQPYVSVLAAELGKRLSPISIRSHAAAAIA